MNDGSVTSTREEIARFVGVMGVLSSIAVGVALFINDWSFIMGYFVFFINSLLSGFFALNFKK